MINVEKKVLTFSLWLWRPWVVGMIQLYQLSKTLQKESLILTILSIVWKFRLSYILQQLSVCIQRKNASMIMSRLV